MASGQRVPERLPDAGEGDPVDRRPKQEEVSVRRDRSMSGECREPDEKVSGVVGGNRGPSEQQESDQADADDGEGETGNYQGHLGAGPKEPVQCGPSPEGEPAHAVCQVTVQVRRSSAASLLP